MTFPNLYLNRPLSTRDPAYCIDYKSYRDFIFVSPFVFIIIFKSTRDFRFHYCVKHWPLCDLSHCIAQISSVTFLFKPVSCLAVGPCQLVTLYFYVVSSCDYQLGQSNFFFAGKEPPVVVLICLLQNTV